MRTPNASFRNSAGENWARSEDTTMVGTANLARRRPIFTSMSPSFLYPASPDRKPKNSVKSPTVTAAAGETDGTARSGKIRMTTGVRMAVPSIPSIIASETMPMHAGNMNQ
jgi:hypothetical protein